MKSRTFAYFPMDQLCGYYKLIKSENFDEYMKKIGISWSLRTLGNTLKPSIEISSHGDGIYALTTRSTFKNSDINFRLGEQLDETTIDGRVFRTTFTFEDNKLIQRQVPINSGDKLSVITRERSGENMIATFVCEDVEAVRTYVVVEK
uniref:Cytosolic fatty-acid binding proteins domain-containing protein n=1 Tax=Romanomermis culicivorax TaxID=13658 RepID=A0A915KZW0_ROMCU